MPTYTTSASGAIIDPYTGQVVSAISNSITAQVLTTSIVSGTILVNEVTDASGNLTNITNVVLPFTGTLGYQANTVITNFGSTYSYNDFYSNTLVAYSVDPLTMVLTPTSNTAISSITTLYGYNPANNNFTVVYTGDGTIQWANVTTLSESTLRGTAHTNQFANAANASVIDSISTINLSGNLAPLPGTSTIGTTTINNQLLTPSQSLSLTVTTTNAGVTNLFASTTTVQSTFEVVEQSGSEVTGNIVIHTSTGETILGNLTLIVQSSNAAVGMVSNAVSSTTTTGTITPLMFAAGFGLMQNTGLNLNQNFNSNVKTYSEVTPASSSAFGGGLQGVLVSDGSELYDLFVLATTTTNQTPQGPVSTTVYTTVRNQLGSIDSVFPGGWAMDGRVYTGSMSGLGGMAADRSSAGYQPAFIANLDQQTGNITYQHNAPVYSGRYGTYYGNPSLNNLGAGTIPAITQVIPSSVSGISGSLKYWLDQAVNRPLGSKTDINIKYFINVLGQAYGWVSQGNRYLNAVRTAEKTNFNTYNVENYSDYTTSGWKKYKTGNALPRAFTNIGTMTDTIYTGNFGTVGAVTYTLLGRGLGTVGNLTAQLTAQRVNTSDVMNPIYTEKLTRILSNITLPDDLDTIQGTLESAIPNMSSPLDYTDIGKSAGQANDSEFVDFAEIGTDLYNKTPYMTITRGSDVTAIISNIAVVSDARVESAAGSNSLLSPTITTQVRNLLPVNEYDTTVTLFDIIGAPSGYLTEAMRLVNEGLAELEATSYGEGIKANLKNILQPTNILDDAGNSIDGVNTNAIADYNNLLNQILADNTGRIQEIVKKINNNYEFICKHIAIETINWDRAKINTTVFDDSNSLMSFATSLHQYAIDSQNVGSYPYLVGMTDNTQTGAIIASVLTEGRNNNLLQNYNVSTNGYIG